MSPSKSPGEEFSNQFIAAGYADDEEQLLTEILAPYKFTQEQIRFCLERFVFRAYLETQSHSQESLLPELLSIRLKEELRTLLSAERASVIETCGDLIEYAKLSVAEQHIALERMLRNVLWNLDSDTDYPST